MYNRTLKNSLENKINKGKAIILGKGTLELNLATGVYTMRFIALDDDNKTVTKKLVVL